MKEAAKRICYITTNYNWAMNGIASDARIVSVTPFWQVMIYAAEGLFAVLSAGAVLMYAVSSVAARHARKKKN
jgi:beta-glucosidase